LAIVYQHYENSGKGVCMNQLTRQEIYEQIKASSKEEFILKEMQRLGYWAKPEQPNLAADLIQKKTNLQKQLTQLSKQIQDPQAALKALHQQRMAEARQKRIDTKVKHEALRYQRALNWHQLKQQQIHYLGNAAGFKTDNTASDSAQLQSNHLPIAHHAADLAKLMGISLNELRFLTYSQTVSKVRHYQHFAIQKKTGGTRLISAPMPRLKRLQYWVLVNILQPLPLTEQAHGFVHNRSIVSNAKPHVGQAIVINLDLKDFFPTISYARILGLFKQLGYNTEVASLLALLCSESETQAVEMDGQRYFIQQGSRRLPQGAPSSPLISNLVCRRLDKRLQGLASKYGFAYTRYADDLSFSTADKTASVRGLLHWVKATILEEGFTVHPDKTRIMRQGARQEVTGVVVNQHLSLDKHQLKRFRALLFQIDKDGYTGKTWGNGKHLLASVQAYAHYVKMVNPSKGLQFLQQIAAIEAKHGQPRSHYLLKISKPLFRNAAALGQLPLASMSVAQAPPAPQLSDIIQHPDLLEQVQQVIGALQQQVVTEETVTAPPINVKASGLVQTMFNLFRGKL
jgi:retron-type reverse transcriptase